MTTTHQDLIDAEVQAEIERPYQEMLDRQAVEIATLTAKMAEAQKDADELKQLLRLLAPTLPIKQQAIINDAIAPMASTKADQPNRLP